MTETKAGDFNWGHPTCGALGAVILVLPQMIFGNNAVFATIPLAGLIGLILVAVVTEFQTFLSSCHPGLGAV
jgi:hypothetical protein